MATNVKQLFHKCKFTHFTNVNTYVVGIYICTFTYIQTFLSE